MGDEPRDDGVDDARAAAPFSYSGKLAFLRSACCDTRLVQSDLAVLSVLVDHANKVTGIADYQSVTRIVAESGVPKTTAIRAIRRLEGAGWIVPAKRFGVTSSYVLTGADIGTGSTAGTGAISNLLRGKTGATTGTGPVPHPEHIQGLQEKQKLQGKSTRMKTTVNVDLPTWLPADAWQGWIDHRKQVGRKFTEAGQQLAISRLESLKAEGHDPRKLINLAIECGWSSFNPRPSTKADGASAELGDFIPRQDQARHIANLRDSYSASARFSDLLARCWHEKADARSASL